MFNKAKKLKAIRLRRHKHILKKIQGTPNRPRLVVFRSNKNIFVQLVDDVSRKTLGGASTLTKEIAADVGKAKSKVEKATLVGKEIASLAKKKKISEVVFDRNGYLYHGRVKALAEGAREAGLKF
jgi:large subunit ribosomal protein L18